jgi:hypothetical protein
MVSVGVDVNREEWVRLQLGERRARARRSPIVFGTYQNQERQHDGICAGDRAATLESDAGDQLAAPLGQFCAQRSLLLMVPAT